MYLDKVPSFLQAVFLPIELGSIEDKVKAAKEKSVWDAFLNSTQYVMMVGIMDNISVYIWKCEGGSGIMLILNLKS